MEQTAMVQSFHQAVSCLPQPLCQQLLQLPDHQKSQVQEIRLRLNQPLAFTTPAGPAFGLAFAPRPQGGGASPLCTAELLEQSFRALCGYSVHTHQQEIAQGFLSLPGGHRAGIAGAAVLQGDQVVSLRAISSLNLRIARQVKGCARRLGERLFQNGLSSFLIAGPPSSGKTTLLRDLARLVSSGELGECRRVAVVDERLEISGGLSADLGCCCDVLSGFPKAHGILQAVRTLSPELLLCDELGAPQEVEALLSGLNSGVQFGAAIHAASRQQLYAKPQVQALLRAGALDSAVLLGGGAAPGVVREFLDLRRDPQCPSNW